MTSLAAARPPSVPPPPPALRTHVPVVEAGMTDLDVAEVLTQALDGLHVGVAALDADGRTVHANAACRAAWLLAGWRWDERRLLPGPPDGQGLYLARWRTALADVSVWGRRRLLDCEGRAGPVFVALSPLALCGRVGVLATVGRCRLCGPLELQLFATAHGLSHAELRVLDKLVEGKRPADIARLHDVAPSTVCTQIAAIRGKTGSGSVQDLLLAISRLPPVRPALSA